jgi:TolB-like protein/Flp pilus assembly protein TadD
MWSYVFMEVPESRIIAFDEFELDLGRSELRRNGQPVAIEPQVFDLIAYFAANPGEILTRDDLIGAVWGGRIISESTISTRINAVRNVLGDDGVAQRIIRTISRRGFRFESKTSASIGPDSVALPDKPSIAVLPFLNLSNDPDQAYFSDGITDDIITDLCRYDELFVIARHSSFTYRDTATPTAQIARELGVQYLAEGSVRRVVDRVRVTVQLIDPWAGNQLWAERYDRELEDIFAVQDEITAVIVNTLAGQIARQHYKRVLTKRPEAVVAYDHVLKASEHALKVAPEDNSLARAEAEMAIQIDPTFARAHAILSLTHVNEGNNFWTAHPKESFGSAFEAANAAVKADERDPWAHAMHGISELWHNRACDRAVSDMQRALELNPNNSYIRGLFSYVLAFANQADRALIEIDVALRMNPYAPAIFQGFRGRALLIQRRIVEALPCLQEMVTLMPGHSNALGYVAVAFSAAGRKDEARAVAETLRISNPNYTCSALRRFLPFQESSDRDFIVDMLSCAGLPE